MLSSPVMDSRGLRVNIIMTILYARRFAPRLICDITVLIKYMFSIFLLLAVWNYSMRGIDLGREMVNYTSTSVSYAKDSDIRASFLTNTAGDESKNKNKKKGVVHFYFNLRLSNTNEMPTCNL